jgi:DNA-binding CsgD family transcriptional regulator
MDAALFEKLTEPQRACLRRVYQLQTSKDIARDLGISPHTVDQRLRVAARTLGVATRIEAARLLAKFEQTGGGLYQPLVYQSLDVAPDEAFDAHEAQAVEGNSTAEYGLNDTARERQLNYRSFVPEQHRSISIPLPLGLSDENKLGIWSRVAWIVFITIAVALSFGAILSGLESLGSIFAR